MAEADDLEVYFAPPAWPPERVHLQHVIGGGRWAQIEEISLQLSLRARQTEGSSVSLLPIALSLEAQTVFAWVEEIALAEWLVPILTIPNIAALDAQLRCAACAWMLAPWLNWCAQHELSVPKFKALGETAAQLPVADSEPVYAVLTLARPHAETVSKRLELMLTGFPYAWLSALACTMPEARPAPQMHTGQIEVSGSAGFARLSADQLAALRTGDVVFATRQASLSAGQLFCHMGALFFQVRQLDPKHFEVEHMMMALDEDTEMISDMAQCTPESTVGDLPVTLIFEIGRLSVPLSELTRLQVGDVLETALSLAPEIGIRAQGKLIASAKLVRMGERLGAQITHMMNSKPEKWHELHGETDTSAQADPCTLPSNDLLQLEGTDPLQ